MCGAIMDKKKTGTAKVKRRRERHSCTSLARDGGGAGGTGHAIDAEGYCVGTGGGMKAASKPISEISCEGVMSTIRIEKLGKLTLMSFSGSQRFGSYSTTPRSASRATLIECIPDCGRNTPPIAYHASQFGSTNCIVLTHLHARPTGHTLYSQVTFF